MTDSRQQMNDYNDAIELAPVLNQKVIDAQEALKPYQDLLNAAIQAQNDNLALSENLKAQIIQELSPAIKSEATIVSPTVDAPIQLL